MASGGNDRAGSEGIEREATAWFVRMRESRPDEADRDAFRRWLDVDARHGEAFREVEALWRDLGAPASAVAAEISKSKRSARVAWRRATAVGALLAASVALIVWRDPGLIDRARADHATGLGERTTVSLSDGSSLFLDADSAVTEDFGDGRRDVAILRGRVWFDVKPDASRPFRVRADDVDVRVTGTAFGVDAERGLVTVEHGSVSVAAGGEHLRLAAGQQVAERDGRLAAPQTVDPASALAWRRGLIVLDAAPLDEALSEFSRMAGRRLFAPQQEVRELRVSGVFRTDDPATALEVLRSGLGLRAATAPGFATVLFR